MILDRFQKQKIVFNIFLKDVFLKGEILPKGKKAQSVLAMSIFLFSLIVLVSQFFETILFVFWLALFNWSAGQVEHS